MESVMRLDKKGPDNTVHYRHNTKECYIVSAIDRNGQLQFDPNDGWYYYNDDNFLIGPYDTREQAIEAFDIDQGYIVPQQQSIL